MIIDDKLCTQIWPEISYADTQSMNMRRLLSSIHSDRNCNPLVVADSRLRLPQSSEVLAHIFHRHTRFAELKSIIE